MPPEHTISLFTPWGRCPNLNIDMLIKPHPSDESGLLSLRIAAEGCRGCPLYQDANQTIFGEGKTNARLVVVGDQPGSEEDLQGRVMVGPAGRMFEELMAEANLARGEAYLTYTVKHFKFEYVGGRRVHQRPTPDEVRACVPWLEAELEVIRPQVLLLLGFTAADALLGPHFPLAEQRGQVLASPWCERTIVTIHPLVILLQRTPQQAEAARRDLLSDLRTVAQLLSLDRAAS
jgi:uracil-DNA glycosylase family protein